MEELNEGTRELLFAELEKINEELQFKLKLIRDSSENGFISQFTLTKIQLLESEIKIITTILIKNKIFDSSMVKIVF